MTDTTTTTTTATSDTDDSSTLAPDTTDTTDTLTDAYNANTTITAYCHSLLNTSLTWNTSTQGAQPDWFTTLAEGLATAQDHANVWLVGTAATDDTPAVEALGSAVFSTVPQTIINYGDTFMAATNNILSVMAAVGDTNTPTAQQQAEINALIEALISQLQAQQTTLTSIQTQLQTFATDVQNDYNTLETGQNNASEAVDLLEEDEASIQAQINLVTEELTKDSALATSSEIGLGTGIFVVVAAAALAVATDGATVPLLVCAVGVITTGAAIAGTVVFSDKVNDDLKKLYSLQEELSDEQRQVSALSGMMTTLQTLIDANTDAQTAISDVMNMWSVLEAKLAAVLTDLEDAETNQMAILEELDIETAQTAWTQLVEYAGYMETGNITVSTTSQPGMQITTTTTSSAA